MESELLPMNFDDVVPITQEILQTQKTIDDKEWEGSDCTVERKHLQQLLKEQSEGELWYALF